METSNRTIKCEACGGQGYFVEDFHDPNDSHGHGQHEEKCEKCKGTGEVMHPVIALWERVKQSRYFTPLVQARVKQKVLEGMDLDRALRNEGLMVPKFRNMSSAKQLFENGLLEIGEQPTYGIDMGLKGAEMTVETVQKVEGTAEGFIPRPKPQQNG